MLCKFVIGIMTMWMIFPVFSQSREKAPYLILDYIVAIDSIHGYIIENYYPDMQVGFTPPFGEYDRLDKFIVYMKGYTPILPFTYIIKGKIVSYPDEAFIKIAQRYGDTCFNKSRWFPYRFEITDPVVNDTFLGIHITCDQDYDSVHLKGAFLDDIVCLEYERHILDPMDAYKPIHRYNRGLLSDYNKEQKHTFTQPFGHWGLLSPPAHEGVYIFTLLIIDEKRKIHYFSYPSVKMKNEIKEVWSEYSK